MSQLMDSQRRRHVIAVGGLALILAIAAVTMVLLQARQDALPAVSGPVVPDWAATSQQAQQIEITGSGGRFTIERRGEDWVMPSRDDHPVRRSRIAEIDAFLAGLSYEGARTADPLKHVRLNLGEQDGDGAGLRLVARDASGETLADLVLGRQSGDLVYLRSPGTTQTYAARLGESAPVPQIGNADDWLELDFLALGRSDIALTRIQPERGPAYLLERSGRAARNFVLREPGGWRPITAGAANGPGAAMARLRFRDVRRADRLGGQVVASHVAQTFSGLEVSMSVIAQGETRWAVLDVRAVSNDQIDAAAALAERTGGWAYLLSDLSLDRLLRPLDEIADERGETDAP